MSVRLKTLRQPEYTNVQKVVEYILYYAPAYVLGALWLAAIAFLIGAYGHRVVVYFMGVV